MRRAVSGFVSLDGGTQQLVRADTTTNMGKYITELIGTFFLVLTIGLCGAHGLPLAPVAIGLMLTALVYMGGHVSGAHYNPAVTLAMVLRGKTTNREAVIYIAAQMIGGILAVLAVAAATQHFYDPRAGGGVDLLTAFLTEVIFTFALVLVILNVATSRRTQGNEYYGVAIGLVVAGAAFVAGPISGAVLNPAVGIAPALVNLPLGEIAVADFGRALVLYLAAPVVGSLLAWGVFVLQEEA